MGKKKSWEPGQSETAREIRHAMLETLMKYGMSESREDCLDFMYETMVIAGAGAYAAGLTGEQALEFFEAALEDIYNATVLATLPGVEGGAQA
jgi:hypothetical protein|tara:strand:+ start:18772 stop:19050 length:279 start_codon:yes stop_codon:yes gene_type:complete